MEISEQFLNIDNTNISDLVDYEVEPNKLWKDAERNMNGDVRASLIGVFPKIYCKTTTADRAKIAMIANLLVKPNLIVKFYNPMSNSIETARYYAGDFKMSVFERKRGLFKPMTFNLIPISKRNI